MEIVQDYDKYPIISAVIDEDISKINFYLKRKANVNETNQDRNTALIVAAYLGNTSICEYLIKKGALVDYSNKQGKNALMIAYENNQHKVVQVLASKGAKIDLETVSGTPYLYNSVSQNDAKMVKIMLDAGVSTEKVNEFGDTPLQCAIRQNNVSIAEMLFDYGANIFDDKYNNYSVLMNACDVGNVNVVKWLIKHDSKLEHKSIDGRTAIMIAAQLGHTDVVELLIKNGADIESKDYYGATALMKAAQNGHFSVVELLNEKGANINSTDDDGWTALHYACLTGEVKIIRYLLEDGINKKFRVDPIVVAIESFQLSTVLLLSQNGFSLNNKLPDGRTYLTIAEEVNCKPVALFLRDVTAGIFNESKLDGYLTYDENYETVDSVDEELEGLSPTQFSIKKAEIPVDSEEEDIFEFDPDFIKMKDKKTEPTTEEASILSEIEDKNETEARSERLRLLDELSTSFNLDTEINSDVSLNVDTGKLNQDIKNDLEKIIKKSKISSKEVNLNESKTTDKLLDQDINNLSTDLDELINQVSIDNKNLDKTVNNRDGKVSSVLGETKISVAKTNIENKNTEIFDEIDVEQIKPDSKVMDLDAIEKEIQEIQKSVSKLAGEENIINEKTDIAKESDISLDDLLADINSFSTLDDDLSSLIKNEPSKEEQPKEIIIIEKNDTEQLTEIIIENKVDKEKVTELDSNLSEDKKENFKASGLSRGNFQIDEVDIEEEFSFSINGEHDFIGTKSTNSKMANVFEEFDFPKRAPNTSDVTNNMFKIEPEIDTITIEKTNKVQEIVSATEDVIKETIVINKVEPIEKATEHDTVQTTEKINEQTTEKVAEQTNKQVTKVREDDAEFVNFEALSYDDYIPKTDEKLEEEVVSFNKNSELMEKQKQEKIIEDIFRMNVDLVHEGRFRPQELYDIIKSNSKYLKTQPIEDKDFVEIIEHNVDILSKEKINEGELFDILKINIINQAQFEIIVDKLLSERVNINKPKKIEIVEDKLIDDVLGEENHIKVKEVKKIIEDKDDFITKTVIRALSLDQEYDLGKNPRRPDDSFSNTLEIDGNLYDKNISDKEVDDLIFANKQEEEIYKQYMERLKPGELYEPHGSTLVDIPNKEENVSHDYYAETASASKKERSSSFNPNSHEAIKILNDMFNDKVSKSDNGSSNKKDEIDYKESYNKILKEVEEYRKAEREEKARIEAAKSKEVQQDSIDVSHDAEDETVSNKSLELSSNTENSSKDLSLRTLLQDFVYAVNHNDTDLILGLQNIHFFISELERIQISPLVLAISNNNMILFDYFIGVGATVNTRVEKGFTPLMVAAQYNNPYAIEVLISYGAFIDDISDRDFTALMIAAQRGNLDSVVILCQYGADYYINSTCGNSALILATAKNRINVVEFFVQEGFDLLIETAEGLTALDIAYAKNYHRLIQILSYAMYSNGY